MLKETQKLTYWNWSPLHYVLKSFVFESLRSNGIFRDWILYTYRGGTETRYFPSAQSPLASQINHVSYSYSQSG